MISLDAASRRLTLELSDDELSRRQKAWVPPPPKMSGGYQKLYVEHVLQADRGCDLDFLLGKRGAEIPRHSH
jgi:L-arabonate dehydrase